MKLLVSDYDGTIEIEELFKDSYIPKGTISNIHDFRSAGNKFMIATARPYASIIKEVDRYGIPYDFISTLKIVINCSLVRNEILTVNLLLFSMIKFLSIQ